MNKTKDELKKQILKNLNKEQIEAVLHNSSSSRIIAGPGTGKTTTIIAKILYLIFIEEVNPKSILVITFTNKAKLEIIDRFLKFSDDERFFPLIFTYHSFSTYFLRIEGKDILYKDYFKIFDTTDQLRIIKKITNEQAEFKLIIPKEFIYNLDKIKSFEEDDFKNKKESIGYLKYKLFKSYQMEKANNQAFDFDDLIIKTNEVLEKYPEIREKWINRFSYIFIDEFQDTNDSQNEILKNITTKLSNVTVVGDPDQNLYSWRGAKIDIIMNFPNHFENTKTIVLSQNYRSTPEILELAKNFIKQNQNRIPNELFTFNDSLEEKPKIYEFNSSLEESSFVIDKIKFLLKNDSLLELKDIAIIYRSNYISREFESSLIQNSLKYKVIGGFKFYERKEVKEAQYLLAFLITLENFYFEATSLVPPKGIGEKTLKIISEHAQMNNLSYYESLSNLVETKKINSIKIKKFIDTITTFRKKLMSSEIESLNDFFNHFLKEIGLFDFYEDEETRIDNIKELVNDFSNQVSLENLLEQTYDFLRKSSLASSGDENDDKNSITLITVHSSKGTEFKIVFIVSLLENVFPTAQSYYNNSKDFEEERRSFYVAITRAKEQLFLTWSKGYDFNNKRKIPSSFLKKLDLEIVKPQFNLYNSQSNSFTREFHNSEVENYFKDNSNISSGNNIFHEEFGLGVVLEDLDKYLKIAFDKKIGIKVLVKNHKSLRKADEG